MKQPLNEILDLLGIDQFTPSTYKSSNEGKVREYFSTTIGNTTFLMMSNEFTLNKDKKKVGSPDPKKPIWCVLLDNADKKYNFVIQYSNKAASESLSKDDPTYSRQ